LGLKGSLREGRSLSGGTLRVTNNVNQVTCDFSPTNVTWGSPYCNCPTAGSGSATCSTGPGVTLSLTGCGTGTLTSGTLSQSVTFDRCYSI
jgi:hypothetical protein